MKNKTLKITFLIIFTALALCITKPSFATYQSRGDASSLKNTTVSVFCLNIRKMEASGGTLGLNGVIDENTLLDSSNNGVDVHMAKNTEWGTVALLSDSKYGYAPSETSSATTTGNASGVYQMADGTWEYVAGIYKGASNNYMSRLAGADARYFNSYSSNTPIAGDALECSGWKGASNSYWVDSSYPVFKRGNNALFSFDGSTGDNSSSNSSRAALVVGSGL